MRASGSIFLLLCVVGMWVSSALAQAEQDTEPAWLESPGFLVEITGAEVDGGQVFRSHDFKQLLVLPAQGDEAYLLEIKSRNVSAIRRSDVTVTADGAVPAADLESRPLPGFERQDAEISFRSGDREVQLLPARPLLGETDLATLLARKQEYGAIARDYTPDPAAIEAIRACDQPTEVVAFFGTWCGVCKHRIPALIKTIEVAANPHVNVRYVCVAQRFTAPRPIIEQYNVRIAPTIVVLRDNAEVGRIDKAPEQSIEQSLAEIVGAP